MLYFHHQSFKDKNDSADDEQPEIDFLQESENEENEYYFTNG